MGNSKNDPFYEAKKSQQTDKQIQNAQLNKAQKIFCSKLTQYSTTTKIQSKLQLL